jgi:KRAB domain-containing zinc finger protein
MCTNVCLTHTGDKPLTCDTCDQRLSDNQHLQTHIRTHTSHKPYTCDSWGKRVKSESTLTDTH